MFFFGIRVFFGLYGVYIKQKGALAERTPIRYECDEFAFKTSVDAAFREENRIKK